MARKETAHEPRPPACSQHLPEHGETDQEETFEVVVDQPPVNPHAPRFDAARTGIDPRLTDMCRKSVLKPLKFRKWHGGPGFDRHAESASSQCVRLHASVHPGGGY